MPRLVERELAAVGELERGDQTPAEVRDRSRDPDAPSSEIINRRVHVVAHEIQLVARRPIHGMNRQLRGREGKDGPPLTSIDRGQSHHVAEKRPHAIRIVAEHDDVSPGDHLARAYIGDAR